MVATPQPYKPSGDERSAWSILGLACDPREADDDWKLYFSLSPIYSHDGTYPTMDAPYDGAVRSTSSKCHDQQAAMAALSMLRFWNLRLARTLFLLACH